MSCVDPFLLQGVATSLVEISICLLSSASPVIWGTAAYWAVWYMTVN